MKKVVVLAVFLLLVSAALGFGQQYDKDAAIALMQDNFVELGNLNKAVTAGNFEQAGLSLVRMAANISRLINITPPKGTKAEWEANIRAFLTAAWNGISACVNQDLAGLQAAAAQVKARQSACHRIFRY